MSTQYKRVVLEGPVRNRQDGTFYIGADDNFIDANLIDARMGHVKSVQTVDPPEVFMVGDVLCDVATGIFAEFRPLDGEPPFLVFQRTLQGGAVVQRRSRGYFGELKLVARNRKLVLK